MEYFPYGKNAFRLGYNSLSAENSEKPLNGIQLAYSHSFELSQNAPVFLETGASFQYAMVNGTDVFDGKGLTSEYSLGYFSVPVNVGYAFNIGDSGFAIAPMVGVSAIYNVFAKFDIKMAGKEFNIDWFDDAIAKRFNFGWQAGADFAFRHLVLGIAYAQDFNKFVTDTKLPIGNGNMDLKESKWKRFNVSIGYRF